MSKIIEARVQTPKNFTDMTIPAVYVKTEDDPEKEIMLFSFYPDEISFRPEEFIGLTIKEGKDLRRQKDLKYLRS